MQSYSGHMNAMIAGVFASLSTIVVKYISSAYGKEQYIIAAFHLSLFIIFNLLMLNRMAVAYQQSTTFICTLLNTSINISLTSFAGYMLFGEVLSLMWFIGFGMIILGIYLVLLSNDEQVSTVKQKTE
ncbi:hypothetical protein SNEBB_010210 [Seison nebaliae]|nr:hypothetical protein SNEBB_010210 [Seison nebaliae]